MSAELNSQRQISPDEIIRTDYVPATGRYDEMRGADGALRPHWQYLLDTFQALGRGGIEERRREARRLIRDNGVTYNLYGDAQGISRPWNLELIPLLIRFRGGVASSGANA